ncbi:MAG: M23 family metallopeptidase [Sandaracinaceae bacterium]|nr:M23 family metallopeptidase [Sandaracinaceae bacterium]
MSETNRVHRVPRGTLTPLAAALVLACGVPAPGLDAGGLDAGDLDAGRDGAVRDAALLDASASDAAAPDAGELAWTRVTTADGARLEGELVATYDHSIWWWSPADERTYALFDPRALAEWPDDRSLRFVSSLDVTALDAIARPAGQPTYREAMRGAGVGLERVPLDGVAFVITGGERYHLEENGYGDFAWDLVVHDDAGRSHSGDGLVNTDYYAFEREVRMPVGGIVVEVVSDAPDVPPGPADLDAVNNLVGVQVYGGYYVYLLHLRQGSVPAGVTVGARVETGDLVGLVGNSGVTAEPHLHVVALAYDVDADPARTWSVPAEWRDVWIGARRGTLEPYAVPVGGQYVSNDAF